jgi:anti-anti-sigma factor
MSCQIQVIRKADAVIVEIAGDSFPIQSVQEMRGILKEFDTLPCDVPVAIRTDGLSLLGSSCLSGIIEAAFQLRRRGVRIFVAEARPDILDIFEIASLHAILPIYDTVEDGLQALKD